MSKRQTPPHGPCSCLCHPCGETSLSPPLPVHSVNPLRFGWGTSRTSLPTFLSCGPRCLQQCPVCLNAERKHDYKTCLLSWSMSLVESWGRVHCRCSVKCQLAEWVTRLCGISSAPRTGKRHLGFQTAWALFFSTSLEESDKGCLGKWRS